MKRFDLLCALRLARLDNAHPHPDEHVNWKSHMTRWLLVEAHWLIRPLDKSQREAIMKQCGPLIARCAKLVWTTGVFWSPAFLARTCVSTI